eukprot:2237519-Rhodomonas_salina.1
MAGDAVTALTTMAGDAVSNGARTAVEAVLLPPGYPFLYTDTIPNPGARIDMQLKVFVRMP